MRFVPIDLPFSRDVPATRGPPAWLSTVVVGAILGVLGSLAASHAAGLLVSTAVLGLGYLRIRHYD